MIGGMHRRASPIKLSNIGNIEDMIFEIVVNEFIEECRREKALPDRVPRLIRQEFQVD
jgi:hypothetical protein